MLDGRSVPPELWTCCPRRNPAPSSWRREPQFYSGPDSNILRDVLREFVSFEVEMARSVGRMMGAIWVNLSCLIKTRRHTCLLESGAGIYDQRGRDEEDVNVKQCPIFWPGCWLCECLHYDNPFMLYVYGLFGVYVIVLLHILCVCVCIKCFLS